MIVLRFMLPSRLVFINRAVLCSYGKPYSTCVVDSGYKMDGWGLVASGLRDTSPDELIGDLVLVAPESVDP